jgi:hypothetical protein
MQQDTLFVLTKLIHAGVNIIFRIRKNCPSIKKDILLHLFIKPAKKVTLLIIETAHILSNILLLRITLE